MNWIYLYKKRRENILTQYLSLLLQECPASLVSFPVGWGCRIHWLLLCRGVRLPHPRYDIKQSDGEVPVMLKLWGMRCIPSLPLFPGSLWPVMVAPDRALSISKIELDCILMLNWIACNRTALIFKLYTYAKLNCLKWNCFCMVNWIVWYRIVWLNWIAWNRNIFAS